jgi:hypothetical protein
MATRKPKSTKVKKKKKKKKKNRRVDNIKMDLRDIGWSSMDWIDLA